MGVGSYDPTHGDWFPLVLRGGAPGDFFMSNPAFA